MPGEWLSRALLLDPMAIPGDSACWADARDLGMARLPILLGWRRAGGALVTGTSEGVATRELWTESSNLAESTARWTGERWDAAFRTFWKQAKPPLRRALSERLPLPDDVWTLESWAAAVWGSFAGPVEPPAVAVVGSEVSEEVLASVTVASGAGRAAAFVVEPLDAERERIRCALVAGDLDPGPRRALPGEPELVKRHGRIGIPADESLTLIDAVERVARRSGATATWSRRDWVRFEGAHGSIRVFPRDGGAWLQLAGADEGALAGLRYRHGLPLALEGPPDPPPGAHLFLRDAASLTPSVEAMIRQWLRGAA
ncbi:MAG TPA: hypothetical protein VFH11_07850 [Gemmatimonadota bacterium]|nr:hypothetical protein [Gemmatimonadota bacterium]